LGQNCKDKNSAFKDMDTHTSTKEPLAFEFALLLSFLLLMMHAFLERSKSSLESLC